MKKRLDIILVERELAATRTQAKELIIARQVSSSGRILDKPGQSLDEAFDLHLGTQPKYVGRAGGKLASVAEELNLNFNGQIVLDVGSSTGGFTDFALQNGAIKSYCVDVGTGQLSYRLRQDPRVVVMEQTDIRVAVLPEPADVAVIDVSFISLTKILEPVAALVGQDAPIVAMAKPQFEAGKRLADKYRGVIPMGAERDAVLHELEAWLTDHGFAITSQADSKVAGMEGNVERFYRLNFRR